MKCPVLYFIPPQSRLFNSRLRCGCGHRCALVAIASQPPWAVGHAQRAIQVLMHDDRTAGERPAPTHLVDLQGQVLKLTVLSRLTVRSNCKAKVRSRSRRGQAVKAVPRWAAAT